MPCMSKRWARSRPGLMRAPIRIQPFGGFSWRYREPPEHQAASDDMRPRLSGWQSSLGSEQAVYVDLNLVQLRQHDIDLFVDIFGRVNPALPELAKCRPCVGKR